MAFRLRVTARALRETQAAYDWYERQRPQLGAEFISVLDVELRAIRERPTSYPIVHRSVRRALLRRFPYAVFFDMSGTAVLVIAVLHAARDPRRWPSP